MWQLAWRNLWRNRARTIITASAIALTLGLQLFSYGINDSAYEKMKSSAETSAGGAILIHADGYWTSLEAQRVIRDAAPVIEAVKKVPSVEAVIPRIIVTGLISSPTSSAGVRLVGINRTIEAKMSDPARFLMDGGNFLDNGPDDKDRIPLALGKSVVEDLNLEIGGWLRLRTLGPDGQDKVIPCRLTGILDTGSEMTDQLAAYAPLGRLQQALGIPEGVTQLGLILTDGTEVNAAAAQLRVALSESSEKLETLTWGEAMPELVSFIEIDKQWGDMFGLMIFIVVAFGITNTFLMAVLERVRELGLLGALGMTPARVAKLMVAESILLGLVSVAAAIVLGLIGHTIVARYGIDYSQMLGGDVEISGVIVEDMIIYSHIDPVRWMVACIAVLVLIIVAASYPAWKATRMQPASAMRTYE